MKSIISKEVLEKMKKMYEDGYCVREIASFFNFANSTVAENLKKTDLKFRSPKEANKKYYTIYNLINHSIFNKIDSEEKAYFLGFLYADGNISDNRNNKS
jgi:predicted DNA-binding protein YlxM (UPF0122 family)